MMKLTELDTTKGGGTVIRATLNEWRNLYGDPDQSLPRDFHDLYEQYVLPKTGPDTQTVGLHMADDLAQQIAAEYESLFDAEVSQEWRHH